MKKLNFQIKRIFLLAVLAVFLAFSVIDTAGITLPFIEIPLDEETGETVVTGEPVGEETDETVETGEPVGEETDETVETGKPIEEATDQTVETGEPIEEEPGEAVETGEPKDLSNQTDLMELETGDQTNGKTETDSKQIFATPEPDQKGCGSTLLQSGAITVLIIGIAVSFLTRKKKSTE